MKTLSKRTELSESFAEELGILRLEIDGTWTAQDFGNLLLETRNVYLQFGALDFIVQRAELLSTGQRNRSDPAAPPARYPYIKIDIQEFHQAVSDSPLTYVADIYINSLRYESPGWIELIGSLNPVKVIADGIEKWREQNRLREQDKRRAILEEMKLRHDFVKLIAEEAKPLRRLMSNGDFERLLQTVIGTTGNTIAAISKDARITAVDVSRT